jgi:hypothetical protein
METFFDLIDPIMWRRSFLGVPAEIRHVIYTFMPYQTRVFCARTCHFLRNEAGVIPLPAAYANADSGEKKNPLIREMIHRVLLQGPWWFDQIPHVRGFMFGIASTLELKCQLENMEGGPEMLALRFRMTLESAGLEFRVRPKRTSFRRMYERNPHITVPPLDMRYPPPDPHGRYMLWSTDDYQNETWSWPEMKQQLAYIPWEAVDANPYICPLTPQVEMACDNTRVPLMTRLNMLPGRDPADILNQFEVIGRVLRDGVGPGQDMAMIVPNYAH